MKKFGVNIPVVGWGFFSAEDVINAHIEKLEEAEKVWFSTSAGMDVKKIENVEEILFSNKNGLRYIAKVVEYKYFENKGIPSDAEKYCPEFCNDVAEKYWFLLDSIEPISPDEVEKFSMINKVAQEKFGNVEAYIENTKRLQIFYYSRS